MTPIGLLGAVWFGIWTWKLRKGSPSSDKRNNESCNRGKNKTKVIAFKTSIQRIMDCCMSKKIAKYSKKPHNKHNGKYDRNDGTDIFLHNIPPKGES